MARFFLIATLLIFSVVPQALAVPDPHQDTADGASCLFCHIKGFDSDANKGSYTLLETTIDAVCLRCHTKSECCVIGQKHMGGLDIGINTHPSDVDESDIKEQHYPQTLPLQDHKLTCNTCHFHRRPAGQDYKLVRIVAFTNAGIDWAGLCKDCHKDY